MGQPDILDLYQQVADISEQMLIAARTSDWDRLASLESTCSARISLLKNMDLSPRLTGAEREEKVRIIQAILNNDRAIRDITEPWMAQLSLLMQNTGAQRKLSQAYGG